MDFLTFTVDRQKLNSLGVSRICEILPWLGLARSLSLCSATGRPRNFYPDHASILLQDDNGGQLAGFIAWSDSAACVSISGVGCAGVRNWLALADLLDQSQARITRCDVAYDDFNGDHLSPALIRDLYLQGQFNSDGRPPKGRFIDDYGTGQGCTAYVGGKGYRELCCYEKGKQLDDATSPWVRLEGRFYSKHTIIDTDILRQPLRYLRGMYSVLGSLLQGMSAKLETVKRQAISSATAMVTWLRRQCGGALNAVSQAFPDQTEFAHVVRQCLARQVRPRRLVLPTDADTINQSVRLACHA